VLHILAVCNAKKKFRNFFQMHPSIPSELPGTVRNDYSSVSVKLFGEGLPIILVMPF
jgi:hypothetical protein